MGGRAYNRVLQCRGGGTRKFVDKKLTLYKNLFSAKYFHKMLFHQTTTNQTKINELKIILVISMS